MMNATESFPEKHYYSYEEFKIDAQSLVNKCRDYEPCALLAIARGGLTLSHLMAQAMNIRNLYTLNSIHYEKDLKLNTINIFNVPDLSNAKKVLVVDDIVDSGETLHATLNILEQRYPQVTFKTATIFYKPSAIIQADFTLKVADKWIDFFWEVDVV